MKPKFADYSFVSINTLVLSFIAEGVGMEKAHAGKAEG